MISKEMLEKVYEQIKKNSGYDDEGADVIVLGGIIELKIFDNENGSGIDVYKHTPQKDMTDDYDFDDDYLTTVYF